MALSYLLDEHLRGPLWRAIQRHNARGQDRINVLRVGDRDGPSLACSDPEILLWAEGAGCIVITLDEHSIPLHFADHLRGGHHSPGVFTIRPASSLPQIVEFLVLAAFASQPAEWQDRIVYVP